MSRKLRELFQSTALHGYSQIVRDKYTVAERSIWAGVVVASTISALTLLLISWSWEVETPTVTVMESTNYPTWNIPFPAVTVCPVNKIAASAALARAETMQRPANMTAGELAQLFKLFLHVSGLGQSDPASYQLLHDVLVLNGLEIPQLMGELAPPCAAMIERCRWKGTQWRCDHLFQPVNTTEGQCCSFNYYGPRKDTDYARKTTVSVPKKPRRVMASGFQTGLTVLLQPSVDEYFATDVGTYGFKLMMHSANDFPDLDAEIKMVLAGTESFVTINPSATYATDDAMKLKPSLRNCYGRHEQRLGGMMNRSSYVNCMVECRSAMIYARCGCLPYNLLNNGSRKNCEVRDTECVVRARELYLHAVPAIGASVGPVTYEPVAPPCGCLPACTKMQYPAEIITGPLNRRYSFNAMSFFKDIELKNQSLVHIYFADLTAIHYRMDIPQDSLGTLASVGGLLGLFLGFSIITGFEMIYFFTIRLLFDAYVKQFCGQTAVLNNAK
ncbi:sodium channel protein Nach-like [Anopheles cruzii]|uniref:sodium channel protein Nach-like n=1 Tax=Anopheles cruzii TaxID=68878 RepID=UPI0022EC20E3|nr:sodium channel protein Nach-like [Anopheles cruzii]